MTIRPMRPTEGDQIAALIHRSTNDWYESRLGRRLFTGPWQDCRVFPETYEALDPGRCLVAETDDGRLVGSCFVHPRETHVSLGIMNADPDFAGRSVARKLLDHAIAQAGDLPVRLVSSAGNLDSFSLYSRAGFTPYEVYQDMVFPERIPPARAAPGLRDAASGDLDALVLLEDEIVGIRRRKDFEMFIRNDSGIWSMSVHARPDGRIDGFLASVDHPGCRMLGPGGARDEATALALILREIHRFEVSPVVLVPSRCRQLVSSLYQLGARNTEIHLGQSRGSVPPVRGVSLPTFLPESA